MNNIELKQIFNQHYNSLVGYANRFLISTEECEDLVQDVFIGLYENNNNFPSEVSLKVYLYKVVRNKCYNLIKHEKVKNRYVENAVKSINDNKLFLRQMVEEEIIDQLYNAINQLPERKKEIIKLTLKGVKNTDIAETLGIKLQTVKTLKSQSYKILRDYFKGINPVIYFLLT